MRRRSLSDFLLGLLGGLILSTGIEYTFGPIVTPDSPTAGYSEEPNKFYRAPDGRWYPEPTLADEYR